MGRVSREATDEADDLPVGSEGEWSPLNISIL